MNDDLISREALKKYKFTTQIANGVELEDIEVVPLCVIDNAPTVERPQGEWVYDNILNNWKCSECGETPKTIGYVGTMLFMEQHFKFCNHCGADMRGKKNE